ncbi:MAG: glycerol-3-phosphate acyltransferase [Ruminococcaceae bacterium]|nr:glycerol-3-phosphate acyltransferase [Oscillospiraceae bacterium]
MQNLMCLVIGYFFGCISPAAMIAGVKGVDLRKNGSGNLGGTNTMLVIGPKYGFTVMILDALKAVTAARMAQWFFPQLTAAGLVAALGAILGHVYPFYMGFRGGKGLACFAGMIVYHHWPLFFLLLTIGMVLMLIVNYSFIAPMSAAVLFPFFAALRTKSRKVFWITAAASALIIKKHWSNIGKALRGDDIPVREYIRDHLLPGRN